MMWSHCRHSEGHLSQTRSKMDTKGVYEEKRLLGQFCGLMMNYEGPIAKKYLVS